MTTVPGFSSRSGTSTVRQFPMRDEVTMSEMTPGWSNSAAAEDNAVDEKVVEPAQVEDKAVKPRKAAAKKS